MIVVHWHSASPSVNLSSFPGHMANHRDIIFGKYMYLYHIDTHQIFGQCDLYFRNGSIFYLVTLLLIISEVMFKGRPNYIHFCIYIIHITT